jgi:hypothetical protein
MQQLLEESLGREIADIIKSQISPWRAQFDQLEKRLNEIDAKLPGQGNIGDNLRYLSDENDRLRRQMTDMSTTLDNLTSSEVFTSFVSERIEKLISEWPKPRDGENGLPGRDGKDGKNGIDGNAGVDGKDGAAGKDGVGISGTMLGRDGNLIITKTDGSIHDVGIVVGRDGAQGIAGKDGAPGRDGFGFDDMEGMDDGLRFGHRFRRGDLVKEFWFNKASLADFDHEIWRSGITYPRGAVVTTGGSLFICKQETTERPGSSGGAKHWRLAVKCGRDGKDGERGERGPIGPAGKDAALY